MTPLHTDGRVKDSDLELQLDGNTGRTFGLFAESMEMAALVSSGQNTGLSRVRRTYTQGGVNNRHTVSVYTYADRALYCT